tara:strand:+ start:2679 stop:2873 length:195 start_codon:yes stop_codon:yes gene_type:complete
MMAKVKVNGAPAGSAPKPTKFAIIDKQGRIPYGKTAPVKIPTTMKRGVARGMGAATQGGGYWEC